MSVADISKEQKQLLHEFRERTGSRGRREHRPPLPAREQCVRALLLAALLQVTWCFGGTYVWALVLFTTLSLLALVAALVPMKDHASTPSFVNMGSLGRFPLFWAGLAILVIICVQGLNTGFEVHRIPLATRSGTQPADEWEMLVRGRDAISWLPSAFDTGALRYPGPWRSAIFWLGMWAFVSAFWVGVRSRRGIISLLWGVGLSSACLGIVAILNYYENKHLFYLGKTETVIRMMDKPAGADPWGPFIYVNQGAAYLLLATALCLGLAWHYWKRHADGRVGASPTIFLVIIGLFCAASTLATRSRAGIILSAMLFAWIAVLYIAEWRRNAVGAMTASALLMVGLVGGTVMVLYKGLPKAEIRTEAMSLSGKDFEYRMEAAKETFRMAMDKPVWGWGAGCFRYGFRDGYQSQNKVLSSDTATRGFNVQRWSHAHNDYAQRLAEFGIVGVIPFLAGMAWLAWRVARAQVYGRGIMLGGVALVFLHASLDFVTYNPAVLSLLLLVPLALIRLDQGGRPRHGAEDDAA